MLIGWGCDSEASNAIIAAADKPDLRPLWISGNRATNDPEKPNEAGWGGQYRDGGNNKWLDSSGAKIKADRDKYLVEFAERADWMVQ